jgi:hypothetical protein
MSREITKLGARIPAYTGVGSHYLRPTARLETVRIYTKISQRRTYTLHLS